MSLDEIAGASVGDLDTPCLIVDIGRFERNIRHARDFAHAAGKRLPDRAERHALGRIPPDDAGTRRGRRQQDLLYRQQMRYR